MQTKATTWKRLRNLWSTSRTARDIFKVSIGDIASKVFSVATTFLLIRSLNVNDYANYITFSGISTLFSGVIGAGINLALVRFAAEEISKKKEKPHSLYVFAISFQLLVYGLLSALCLLFPIQSTKLLFGEATLDLPLKLGLWAGLGVLIVQFARSLYQAEEKFNRYVGTIWLVQIIIFVCLVILWLLNSLAFQSVAIIFATVQCGIGSLLLIRYLRNQRLSRLLENFTDQGDNLKSFLAGSGWLISYFFILNVFSRTDILMLLRFRDKEVVAVYGVAFQYYSLALLFLSSIQAVLLPKFSKEEMQKAEKQKSFLKQWLQGSVWLIIPIFLFDTFGKSLFVWLNGSIYERSFPIIVIFSIGIWLSMMFSPLVNIIISNGYFNFLFSIGFAALCLNLLLNFLLVPPFGGIGAAIAVVATHAFINLSSLLRINIGGHSTR